VQVEIDMVEGEIALPKIPKIRDGMNDPQFVIKNVGRTYYFFIH